MENVTPFLLYHHAAASPAASDYRLNFAQVFLAACPISAGQIQIPLQGLIIQENREKVKGESGYLCTLTRNCAALHRVICKSVRRLCQAGNGHVFRSSFPLFPIFHSPYPFPVPIQKSAFGLPVRRAVIHMDHKPEGRAGAHLAVHAECIVMQAQDRLDD